VARRFKRPDAAQLRQFKRPGTSGRWSRLRLRVRGTDGSSLATRDNPQQAPKKNDFRRRYPMLYRVDVAASSLLLVRFSPEWATIVSTWATTSDEVLAWCSGTEAPVPAATVVAWSDDDVVDAYGLFDGDQLIAYGEVWVDHDEAETELARIIVSPGRRGGGVGCALTRMLAGRAAAVYVDVYLRVRSGNDVAVRCYGAAGFARLATSDEQRFNLDPAVRNP